MPEGHVFSGLQNRVGPLSIAPAGTKDYSVCSVRAMISSWVSGDRAVKNAEYPATRTPYCFCVTPQRLLKKILSFVKISFVQL